MRAIPNLNVFRPADINETLECWEIALKSKNTPSAIALSRQKLPYINPTLSKQNKCELGAYQVKLTSHDSKITLVASGSEVEIALEAQKQLKENNIDSKGVSMPCQELFDIQPEKYKEKILENFFNKEYFCYMTGFIAGMPFLGDLDQNMRAQRLETPRVKVPKGSVGLTEQFTNIYTFESPGGWNIIGNTPLDVFDSTKEKEPNLINPGDTVIFKPITLDQYKNYNE